MPITRGAAGGSNPAARIIRSSFSPLTGIASLRARRESDSPPIVKPIARWLSPRGAVRLALGYTVSGNRSVKIR
ncbi:MULTISPECIES: hypothetical protein [unclassified Mesorhizobium]|uniref:hypothetical protein n=1 Tax=unclassified Mesorhizobium TaxID=325217 RepID=UPI001925701B|nr:MULTISPECIES: hypothetical protein [unclassified Mesorhizobium]BCG97341.1 hypothetical protein MesoLj131a_62050 [Mesorhizobium sp. 131-2-1]BCH04412.1 hypothetical protein MesoLj131b_64110 [Mesorhizobium sp. 131-2-5]